MIRASASGQDQGEQDRVEGEVLAGVKVKQERVQSGVEQGSA